MRNGEPSVSSPWSELRPDERGLVVAVVQHAETDQVLMVGYMNEEALAATLERRRVTFFSRSKQRLWEKGEASGNTLHLEEVRVDCDGDALLVRAQPVGPTCHTGTTSCFFRRSDDAEPSRLHADDGPPPPPDTMLARVFTTVLERKAGRGATQAQGKSYVRSLLDAGAEKIAAKIREEADELCQAVVGEPIDRVAAETADLFFHALVALAHRDVHVRDVSAIFAKRFGRSGIDEKASRQR
jgi:phosphoribosyl-AMP cyclohydrolase / phosphoribosyl-ATP pyrophosphohydrolase